MSWLHYRALMYKNWILWKRNLFGSLCELLFPVIIFLFLAAIRAAVSKEDEDASSYLSDAVYVRPDSSYATTFPFPEGDTFTYCRDYIAAGGKWIIGLAPDNYITAYLQSKFEEQQNLSGVQFKYFEDNDDIDDYVTNENYEDAPKLCFAVVFTTTELKSYEYYIRFNQSETVYDGSTPVGDYVDIFDFNDYDATDSLIREPKPEFQSQFVQTGFIQIQNWVDNFVLQNITGNTNAYIAPAFVPMYYDDWVDDDFLPLIKDNVSFVFIIAFVVTVARMISGIVKEKEYKIKEMMSMMGLSSFAYWSSWITYYTLVYLVIAIFATVIIGLIIFSYSNFFLIFVFFFFFGLSCMAFSVFISVFFSRAKTALTLGIMIFIITFFVSFAVDDPSSSGSDKRVASIIPSVAFILGLKVIIELEIGKVGIIFDTAGTDIDNYTFNTSLVFLICDTIVLFILAYYLEQVWPTEWGTKRPWNFLFTKSFWYGSQESNEDFDKKIEYGDNVEPVDALLEEQIKTGRCMQVRNLTKKFDENKAVDGLNIDIYQNQILALLGHNGAGKTTTISMLTGLIPPSSGDVKIGDLYLSRDMEKIRKQLGVCPQQNVLFNELTPEEHLYLYAVFKGMTSADLIKQKVEEKIREVRLVPQKDRRSEYLSGGQKRKLSLAIALIADSKIVLLDEPTSGMDLTARRLMWDMLKDNKSERIIILTTHYMQEADILADRIVIISHGKVRCCGSSLFLKKRYGVGYYLTLVKESNVDSPQHTKSVEDFIKGFIPEAKLARNIHAEMNFQIPMSSSQAFNEFFKALDERIGELFIRTYGISVTTLEEVFIRVARGDDKALALEEKDESQEKSKEIEESARDGQKLIETERETQGLFGRHLKGLLNKRFNITKRDYKSLVFEILVPLVLVLAGLSFLLLVSRFKDVDPYVLNLSKYEAPQNIIYPETDSSAVSTIITQLENTEDITVTTTDETTISGFDNELFEVRNYDPYRMGSYFFYNMDSTNNQYEPVIFHNQTAFQSLATYYQLISLGTLQTIDPDIKIVVYNYPLKWTDRVKSTSDTGKGVLGCLIFGLAFSFIPGAIIAYVVREREESVKHQHLISGISLWAYWLSNYIWEIVKYIPVFVFAALFVFLLDVSAFTDPSSSFYAIVLVFALYGPAMISFTYAISFFFDDYSSAQVLAIMLNFVTGSILPIVNYILFIFESTRPFVKVFRWICRLLPTYCLGNGVLYTGSVQALASFDERDDAFDALGLDNAGGDILMLGVDAILYTILLIILETIESNPSLRQFFSKPQSVEESEYKHDEDVEAEEKEALQTNPADVKVNVRKLRKIYGGYNKPTVVAVENVSFNVPKKQCFALLGVNGAGKTTTFRMLTGEYPPTSGEAYLDGFNVVSQLDKARENIGYCPQFDALSELLTCEEHIQFYCEVKGINKSLIPELVTDLLNDLDLTEYRKFPSGTLSGGNKRKLSVAIALIGNPTVVFLDEPSAGMDPETRKKLWRVLGDIKKRDSAVILTTHSMEEAEALCDRMSIMVAGRLRCIGTPTYLRDKYGQGYELELKIKFPTHNKVEKTSKLLEPVLKDSNEVTQSNYKECLEVLDAENLIDQIAPKGSGSALYLQLTTEGMIARDTFSSWVLTEKRGEIIFNWLSKEFNEVRIIEHYLGLYRFKITKQEDRSLGFIFSLVEENKEKMKVSEYAVSPTTLDQIFTAFAAEGTVLERGGDE